MRRLIAVVVAATATLAAQGQTPTRDAPIVPTAGTAAISGVVIDDQATPRPVRRAILSLSGPGLRPSRGAITDDQGRFTIANLPAGRFTLTAERAAFIMSAYGAKRPGRPGTAIAVADGERVANVAVRLWRGAAIAGVLRTDGGAPVGRIAISATPLRAVTSPFMTLTNREAVTTNRDGEFRIFGLEPGAYLVCAQPSAAGGVQTIQMNDAAVEAIFDALRRGAPVAPPAPQTAKNVAWAPVCYPGTASLAAAVPITLAAGQEQTGLDFALQRVATASVDGTVSGPDGQPFAGATVQLAPVVPPGPLGDIALPPITATSAADGSFRFAGVLPAEYRVLARGAQPQRPATPAPGTVTPPSRFLPASWAWTDLSVSGADISGLALALHAPMTVSGKLVFDGTTPPPADLTKLQVWLVPPAVLSMKPNTPIRDIAFTIPAGVSADGAFEAGNLTPGSYRIQVRGLEGSGWIGRSAPLGDRDLFDGDVELTSASTLPPVVVTLTDRHSEIGGTLETAAGAPVSDVFVIVFAADRKYWLPAARRVAAARPGIDGKFLFKDLPAGDYLLCAVTDVDQDEWQDAAFLARLVPASIKISLADGEKKTQGLRLGGGS